MYPLLISAIEQQLAIRKGHQAKREMMLANKDKVVFPSDQPLPPDSSAYIAELEAVLPLLRYLSEPCHPWECSSGSVPDDYFPLYLTISNETTIANKDIPEIVRIAQLFFHQYRPQP